MAKAPQAAGLHCASLDKLHDLDAALELMYYGWRGMTREADAYLAKPGLFAANLAVALLLASRFRLLFEHDLLGKPLRTFPDHA